MPGNQNRQVFTYPTRVSVTPEQDKMLREYAVRFGRVEHSLSGNAKRRRREATQVRVSGPFREGSVVAEHAISKERLPQS